MVRICPKCSYARRKSDDKTPDWQCPSCGIAYQKYIDEQEGPSLRSQVVGASSKAPRAAPMSAVALFFILSGLLAVGYVVYKKVYGPQEAGRSQQQTGVPGPSTSGAPVLAMSAEASAGLAQLTSSKVVLFGTDWCPNCAHVRSLLSSQGVRYTELDVEKDPRASSFQEQMMPVRGFPVTVIGSRIVMGYDEKEILAGLKAL